MSTLPQTIATHWLICSAMFSSNVKSQKQKPSWYCICAEGFVRSSCTSLVEGSQSHQPLSNPMSEFHPAIHSPFDDFWCVAVRLFAFTGPHVLPHFFDPQSAFEALHANVLSFGVLRVACGRSECV